MIINEKNFEKAYNDYFEVVCRFLDYYTHDSYVIEEVVQGVFVKLWEEYNGHEMEYLKTYLYNSARNRILNYLRDHENRIFLLEKWAKTELEKSAAHDCVDREEFFCLLQAAVDALPEKCREVFILSREEQLSYKEIAEIKEISLKTVENQMGKALKKIREYLLIHASETTLILSFLLKIGNR